MTVDIQMDYEARLSGYAGLIHGNAPPGLAPKLAIYSQMLIQYSRYGEELWKIDPLLFSFQKSLEVDLHLSLARLLERPQRSERSLFKFLTFCQGNRTRIAWPTGQMTAALLQEQTLALESQRDTIDAIMGRRDHFFAHLDKEYFKKPESIYDDYPLKESDVVSLENTIIKIIREHKIGLGESFNFHLSALYEISLDNMIRNLLSGRKINFPGQVDHL